jgi:hypothetical protein
LIDGANLSHGPLTVSNLVKGAIARFFYPVPKDSTVQQLIIDEFTQNWESHGLEKVTFLFEGCGAGQTYNKGTQWTLCFFNQTEDDPNQKKFEPSDKFIFLVPISQDNPEDE